MAFLIELLFYTAMILIGGVHLSFAIKYFVEKKWFIFGVWLMAFLFNLSKFIQMSIY